MRPFFSGMVVCSLTAVACFASFACGSTQRGEPSGTAGSVGESGAANDAHAGAAPGGSGGSGPAAGTGGSAGLQVAPDGDPPTEPPPEPHAAMPCDDAQPYELGGGYLVCEDKSLRIGERSACPTTLPRAAPTDPLFFEECALDVDCTAAAHGSCEYGQCKYGCVSDDECAAGELCFCGADVGKCVAAGCRSDADCPADYPCTGNLPFGSDAASFNCQTPLDECESDYDCPGARMHCGSDGERRYCYRDLVG